MSQLYHNDLPDLSCNPPAGGKPHKIFKSGVIFLFKKKPATTINHPFVLLFTKARFKSAHLNSHLEHSHSNSAILKIKLFLFQVPQLLLHIPLAPGEFGCDSFCLKSQP